MEHISAELGRIRDELFNRQPTPMGLGADCPSCKTGRLHVYETKGKKWSKCRCGYIEVYISYP